MKSPLPGKQGFSLTELLVGMVILVVLIAISFQATKGSMEEVHKVGCLTNLRQIGLALFRYAADHQQMLPYQANAEPHYTPAVLAVHLVGSKGKAGYLPWDGAGKATIWTNVLQCPADPNRELYARQTVDILPRSYVYRQNAQAGKGGEQLRLSKRLSNQFGYQRWLVADRHVLGLSELVKPHKGESVQLRVNGKFSAYSDRDTLSQQSYWHRGGTNVLVEDGSVSFRRFGIDPLGKM